MKFLALLLVFLFSVPARAQNADTPVPPSNIEYGRSCNDTRIVFWLSAPKRGDSLNVLIVTDDYALKTSAALIALGFIKVNRIIGYANGAPCRLLVSPAWVIPFPLIYGVGKGSLFRVPNDPLLKGLRLFAQAYYNGSGDLSMSRGQQMSVR